MPRTQALPVLRVSLAAAAALLAGSICLAQRPTTYDQMIAREAKIHGVTETFVHRIVMRESRYNPRLVHNHCFGLLQIKSATGRGMCCRGSARGLRAART